MMSNVVTGAFDSFVNFMVGLGGAMDKTKGQRYIYTPLSIIDLEAAFRSDWIARKVVQIPAEDATREWRHWQASNKQIAKLEDVEKAINLRQQVYRALVKARLYGGSAIIIGTVNTGDPTKPLDLDDVKQDSLKYLYVLSRYELNNYQLNSDVLSPWFDEPEFYEFTIPNAPNATVQRVHPSRVVRFIGAEPPDLRREGGWGDSVLQIVDDAVKAAGLVTGGIANMVAEAKIDIISIPGFTDSIKTPAYRDKLTTRLAYANQMKSMVNALVIDDLEKWQRIQTNFSALPDVLRMYLLIASGAADIPATRMLSQSPNGLNATGDSDTRNYYDKVKSTQTNYYQPPLNRLDEVLIRSALNKRDPDIYYEWASLWQMTPEQKAALAAEKAKVASSDALSGLIPEIALAKARQNQLIEDGFYPGLEDALKEAEAAADQIDESQPQLDKDNPYLGQMIEADPMPQAKDSRPRSLYVHRDVLNSGDIVEWARSQGFEMVLPDMHVTIIYSRQPVDWIQMTDDWPGNSGDPPLTIQAGGPRLLAKFGEAVVLQFGSSQLCWRHEAMVHKGASFDYLEYQPHITITYKPPAGMDIEKLTPYRGRIVLGPEIFEEIKDDPADDIGEVHVGDFNPFHEPGGSPRGGSVRQW